MRRRPPTSLLLIFALILLVMAIALGMTAPPSLLLLVGAALTLLALALVREIGNERSLRLLGQTINDLVTTAANAPEHIAGCNKNTGLRKLSQTALPHDPRALAEACQTLFTCHATTLQNLHRMTAEWEKTFHAVGDGIVIFDNQRRIVRLNHAATRMLALDPAEVVGRVCSGEIHRDGCDPQHCSALLIQGAGRGVRGELSTQGDDDILEVFTMSLNDPDGQSFGSVHLLRDIARELRSTRQSQQSQQTDGLTGLPNRAQFRAQLQKGIDRALQKDLTLAVLLIDLDHFSVINDGLGHAIGDQLLLAATRRLQETLPADAVLGRLGGDEFAAFLTVPDDTSAATMARALLAAFARPFQLQDVQDFYCTASIGIAHFPADGSEASQLLKQTDVAMYHAKQNGRNTFRAFARDMDSQALTRLRLGTNLRHALERDEFSLHYQPRIDLMSGAVTGMEALLRWTSLEFGDVPPGRFIPLAEENGLILPIGQWVLTTACRQMQRWREEGLCPPRVAVNLSALQLERDDIVASVAAVLQETGLPPHMLELELTETMVMNHLEASTRKLSALREMGVCIALDDFGTGYSSLNYLKNLPLDHIKIDRSFITEIIGDADSASIVDIIISISHSLGLKVIAEGVETASQLTYLFDHQCDEIQGYYLSPPLPAPEFLSFLKHRNAPSPAA